MTERAPELIHHRADVRRLQIKNTAWTKAPANFAQDIAGLGYVFDQIDGSDGRKIAKLLRRLLDRRAMGFDPSLLCCGNSAAGGIHTYRNDSELVRGGLKERAGIAADIQKPLAAKRFDVRGLPQLLECIAAAAEDRRAQLAAKIEIGMVEIIAGIVNCSLSGGIRAR